MEWQIVRFRSVSRYLVYPLKRRINDRDRVNRVLYSFFFFSIGSSIRAVYSSLRSSFNTHPYIRKHCLFTNVVVFNEKHLLVFVPFLFSFFLFKGTVLLKKTERKNDSNGFLYLRLHLLNNFSTIFNRTDRRTEKS